MTRPVTFVFTVAGTICAWGNEAQAHAFGERYDLPVPLWLNLIGAGTVVVLSFVVTALLLRSSTRKRGSPRVNLLSSRWFRPIMNTVTVHALRVTSVGLFAVTLFAGFFGEVSPGSGLAIKQSRTSVAMYEWHGRVIPCPSALVWLIIISLLRADR